MAAPVRRRVFGIAGLGRFELPPRLLDGFLACLTIVVDYAIYVIGPLLICFATAIIAGLVYTFFYVILPMMQTAWEHSPYRHVVVGLHISFVVFLLVNVVCNYALCVVTSNKGPVYDKVVRELAEATGFDYPEFPDEVVQCKRDYEDRMILRMERRRARLAQQQQQQESQRLASATNNETTRLDSSTMTQRRPAAAIAPAPAATTLPSAPAPVPRVWMVMGPQEWGFCTWTNQPKPPRSHYDHVTKILVINMDHYCPWMFNTIGYLNYRYFCNFLLYSSMGMVYGAIISLRPFLAVSGNRNYVGPLWTPARKDETAVAFGFMLCLSVGLAVCMLGGFHLYLVLTAQTTIEFHGNHSIKRRAKKQGKTWKNPYDVGWRRNWQQVYGSRHPMRALMPSSRQPEFLPLPVQGVLVRRHSKSTTRRGSSLGNDGIGIV